jgi:hypothetical protein
MELILKTKERNYPVRYPNLQTVLMVENFIREHNSEFKKMELFEKLPKKMMWGTFQIIMKYLEDNLKIIYEKDKVITYIWNPKLAERMRKRPEIKI